MATVVLDGLLLVVVVVSVMKGKGGGGGVDECVFEREKVFE